MQKTPNHQNLSAHELLEQLAHHGADALNVPETTETTTPADLAPLFAFARFVQASDLRDASLALWLNRVSAASLALALRAFFAECERCAEAARTRRTYLMDFADTLRVRAVFREATVHAMNVEQDRADFLCGTGWDARTAPPATVRAIDEAIDARERFDEALRKYTEARRASEEADAALGRMERDAALVRVGSAGATSL